MLSNQLKWNVCWRSTKFPFMAPECVRSAAYVHLGGILINRCLVFRSHTWRWCAAAGHKKGWAPAYLGAERGEKNKVPLRCDGARWIQSNNPLKDYLHVSLIPNCLATWHFLAGRPVAIEFPSLRSPQVYIYIYIYKKKKKEQLLSVRWTFLVWCAAHFDVDW